MEEDVYETVEEHALEMGAFREEVEGFVYWLDRYEEAKQGKTAFPLEDVEAEIAAHYEAFPKRKSEARERMLDVFTLENQVRNARNQGTPYDDLPRDVEKLDVLMEEIEDVKETYYEARDVGAAARERMVDEVGAEILIDDDWYAEPEADEVMDLLDEIRQQTGFPANPGYRM